MSNTERNAEIVRRRKAGEWPAQIAKAMGLTNGAVAGVCGRAALTDTGSKNAHHTSRPTNGGKGGGERYGDAFRALVVADFRSDVRITAFARLYGIDRKTVLHWIKAAAVSEEVKP